jgi:hypothetical protein
VPVRYRQLCITYDVVRLRFDVEYSRLGRTDESVLRHTNANTYLYRSVLELGTATKSLTTAMISVQIFAAHGHVWIKSIMHPAAVSLNVLLQ